jgi:hypothetical protein
VTCEQEEVATSRLTKLLGRLDTVSKDCVDQTVAISNEFEALSKLANDVHQATMASEGM